MEKMRLFRFLRTAEKEENSRDLEKSSLKGAESAGAVLVRQLIEGEIYEFGEPWRLTSESLSAVVPILRRFGQDRSYLVLQEISKENVFVTDSGRINKVNVALENVKKPVFVRAGTVFKGQGTQSRTNSMGIVLEPSLENVVDVFCVHATHRISSHSAFSPMSSVVPRKIEDVLVSQSKSQAAVWNATAMRGFHARITRCPSCGSSNLLQSYEAEIVCVQCGNVIPPTVRRDSVERTRVATRDRAIFRMSNWGLRDNLVANLDEMAKFNEKVEEMLSKIPADLDNQVGTVIIDSNGVLGLEMFDHPDSWRAFSRSIVRNYADILAKERAGEGLFALRTERIPEAIKKFLEKAESLPETLVFKNRVSETRMLSGELLGEYTTLGSDTIHLILKRKTPA